MHQWQEWNSTHDETEPQFNNAEIPTKGTKVQKGSLAKLNEINTPDELPKKVDFRKRETNGGEQNSQLLPYLIEPSQKVNQRTKHRSQPKYNKNIKFQIQQDQNNLGYKNSNNLKASQSSFHR